MYRQWIRFVLLVAVVCTTLGADTPRPRRMRDKNAQYNCRIGGYVTGEGKATVSTSKATISASGLKLDGGGTGDLLFEGLTLTRDNHFSGTGTVVGTTVDVEGRIDQPDDYKETAIKGVRLTATFKNAQGQYGRVVGWVQAYADGPAPSDQPRQPPGSTRPGSGPRSGPQPQPRPPRDDDEDHRGERRDPERRQR